MPPILYHDLPPIYIAILLQKYRVRGRWHTPQCLLLFVMEAPVRPLFMIFGIVFGPNAIVKTKKNAGNFRTMEGWAIDPQR